MMDELIWKISHLDELSSTNDIAKELASDGCDEGTVVIAGIQTSGRGRLSRRWISPKGGLWFSIILRPQMLPEESNLLNVLASVSICKVIRNKFNLNTVIKWPNDILIEEKKVCGILIENSVTSGQIEYSVIGIGINTNIDNSYFSEELNATSLNSEVNREINNENLLKHILSEIKLSYDNLRRGEITSLLNEWVEMNCLIGKMVKAYDESRVIVGKAIDVDDSGNLIVNTKNGDIHKISSASIKIV
ncbi:biotin--[acetyl-CoA-carboxylase] ligase [Candidatus Bathyarchaeota archaeon]|nr:biotin--[acetyl-CoA-carboxylase] ligase [Candidatus Bathyarchaeota archaeon]